jgi:uncharacterized membrane protein YbhN (UPF0104 family)
MPADTHSSKHRQITGYAAPPLIFRAGITSVFSSLGGFLALLLLGVGIYLLQEAVVDPLSAQPITLVAGAFVMAVASMLIYFIFSSLAKSRSGRSRYRAHSRGATRAMIVAAASEPASRTEPAKDLAQHA